MVTFRDGLASAIRSTVCAAIALDDGASTLFRRVGLPLTLTLPAVREWRRGLCSNVTIPNNPSPAIVGGQCPTKYSVRGEYTRRLNASGAQSTLTFSSGGTTTNLRFGPIGGLFVVTLPGGNSEIRLRHRTSTGAPTDSLVVTTPTASTLVSYQINEIIRLDGLPDDCGNQNEPVNTTPPGLLNVPISVNYDDNRNINNTELGGLTIFAPITNFNGEVSIPVTVDLSGATITGNLNINGEVSLEPTTPVPRGSESEDGIPPEVPPDDEPPNPRKIIGVKAYVKSNNKFVVGVIPQGENPDILIPRAGSVQFLVDAGLRRAWTPDINVKTAVAWIPCPEPGFAYAVAGTPMVGVEWELNPVYDRPEA